MAGTYIYFKFYLCGFVCMCEYTRVSTHCSVHVKQGKKRVLCVILYHTPYIPLRQDLSLKVALIFSLVAWKTASYSNLSLHATPGDRITGMHEVLGLLHGCWDPNSSLHGLIFQPICTIFEIIVSILSRL